VEATKIREELLAANNSVKWVPEHVGSNRFGRWLEGVRDWAVSRQRYWGAPLPIWKNPVTCTYKVFGSLADLQHHGRKSGNTYLIMRHGESDSNVRGVISADLKTVDGLTEHGREQVKAVVTQLREAGIDMIVHSGFQRVRETVEILADALGLPVGSVIRDERLGEVQAGAVFEGGIWDDYNQQYGDWAGRFTKRIEGQENRRDAQTRAAACLFAIEQQYQNKKVLIVSHGGVLFSLECAAIGADIKQALGIHDTSRYMNNAEIRTLAFTAFPHNDDYLLDFHRPYIDDFEVFDTDGTKLVRVPDVFDCWFESGAMPYAQTHYPFANLEVANPAEGVRFPADFIAESVDQTRGWFYSLMVLGVGLFGKSPYRHVITNGLVLAEDGKKMSKKLRNYPDPMELTDRVGADAIRYYLLSSPIIRGEDLNFSEKEVTEQQRKNLGRLHNVLLMYAQFSVEIDSSPDSNNVLDRWIIARLNQLIAESEAGYKAYELDRATRPIADFIDDLSVWYLRRSRERFKSDNVEEVKTVSATLRYVLQQLAKVMAPAMPFYADYLWSCVAYGQEISVHLAAWPKGGEVDPVVIDKMSVVRELVTLALEARTQSGIKVRQPLSALSLNIELTEEYAAIIADEVNVKTVRYSAGQTERVVLNTTLTPELIQEGVVREFVRGVQERRKAEGFAPPDRITLTVSTTEDGQALLTSFRDTIMKTVGATHVVFAATDGTTITAGEYSFTVSLEKVS
jgi:isoleucyl-tRNA synthetase